MKPVASFKSLLPKVGVTIGAILYLGGATPVTLAAEPMDSGRPEIVSMQGSDTSGMTDNSVTNTIGNKKPASADSNSVQSSTDAAPTGGATHVEVKGPIWINQQPASSYTLQLMAATSTKPLLAFALKESLTGPLAVAGFRKDDKMLYLLLQGSYLSRSEAERVAAQIERATGERPWVRKFTSLPELFDSNSPPPRKAETVKKKPINILGAAWLWSRNPVRYTIQLKGHRRVDSLRTFVAESRPDAPVAIVRVLHKGKPWYLLLLGDYASEEEAVAAINALPQKGHGRGPWPRRFASLQDQMVMGNH